MNYRYMIAYFNDAVVFGRYLFKHEIRNVLAAFFASTVVVYFAILIHFKVLGFDILPIIMDPAAPIRSLQTAIAGLLAIFSQFVFRRVRRRRKRRRMYKEMISLARFSKSELKRQSKNIKKLEKELAREDQNENTEDDEGNNNEIRSDSRRNLINTQLASLNNSFERFSNSIGNMRTSFMRYRELRNEEENKKDSALLADDLRTTANMLLVLFILFTALRLYPRVHNFVDTHYVSAGFNEYCEQLGDNYWTGFIFPRCYSVTLRPGGDGSIKEAGFVGDFVDYGHLGAYQYGLFSDNMSALRLRKEGVEVLALTDKAISFERDKRLSELTELQAAQQRIALEFYTLGKLDQYSNRAATIPDLLGEIEGEIEGIAQSVGFNVAAFRCATRQTVASSTIIFQFPLEGRTVCFPTNSERPRTIPFDGQVVNQVESCNELSEDKRGINAEQLKLAVQSGEQERSSEIFDNLRRLVDGEQPEDIPELSILGLSSPEGNRESNFLTSYQRAVAVSNALANEFCELNEYTLEKEECIRRIKDKIRPIGAGITWSVSSDFNVENLGGKSTISEGKAALLFIQDEKCRKL